MIIPVPIPNTEVKRSHADGTAEMRESRTPPGLFLCPEGNKAPVASLAFVKRRHDAGPPGLFYEHYVGTQNLRKKFSVPTSFMSYELGGGFQNWRAEKPGLF